MKCGRGHQHGSVAEVRACYGSAGVGPSGRTSPADAKPSPRQVRFIHVLLGKNRAQLAGGRKPEDLLLAEATPIIDGLLDREKRGFIGSFPRGVEGRATRAGSDPVRGLRGPRAADADGRFAVSEGLYATPSLTGNNDLDFWRVKHGRGFLFVNRVLGGHQDLALPGDSKKRIATERIGRVDQDAALEAILAFDGGPEASQELAGKELKFCGKCGIHLTDETSRELGVGPICRAK